MHPRIAFVAPVVLALGACEPSRPPSSPSHPVPVASATDVVPESATAYGSDPSPNVILGGPASTAIEARLLAALHERGDTARGDGRLGELSSFAAKRAARGLDTDPDLLEALTRRVGFVGPTPWIVQLRIDRESGGARVDAEIRKALASYAQNVRLTRYGIASVERGYGSLVVLTLGTVSLQLKPVPKRVALHEVLSLEGIVGEKYSTAEISITAPDGSVRSIPCKGREFGTKLNLAPAGVYKVEVNGDGAEGPVVLANFPVYVGEDEPVPTIRDDGGDRGFHARGPTAREVEEKLFVLLNDARRQARLEPLRADPALAEVARADAQDMVDHGFFSHVSPTQGTLEERLLRGHVRYPVAGENISRASSPEEADRGLMESPGHRANILSPDFTHVGIGAVVQGTAQGSAETAVFDFAREHPIALADVPAQVLLQMNVSRQSAGLPPLSQDDALAKAAQAGLLTEASSLDDAAKAARHALDHVRSGACILALVEHDVWRVSLPVLESARGAVRLGVAAAPVRDEPESFRLIVVAGLPKGGKTRCE